MSAPLQPPDELSLLVKNPAGAADAQVRVPASATVGDVKRTLSREYSGNPDPSLQTVIYAGKVLKDERVKLTDVAKQALEAGAPLSIHLVVKQPAQAGAPQAGVRSPATSASQPSSGSEQNSSTGGPAAGTSGQASSSQAGNHAQAQQQQQQQQQRGLNGAAPEWPFPWPEAFPAGMPQFPGGHGMAAGPSTSGAGPSSSGADPGLGQNGGSHPHMHAMPMHWQQLPGEFPGLPAGFPAGMPQMMPFQHVGPQPVMALSMPPHFPQPFPWPMPLPAMQPQAGAQPVAPTIPTTSSSPSSTSSASQPSSSPGPSGSSPAATPSQTPPPPNGMSGTSGLPQAAGPSTGPTAAFQQPHLIPTASGLPNITHLHTGPIPNGCIPGMVGPPQAGFPHPGPHLMGFPGVPGQQLMHPTMGPLQMMPVTQMVQVMVPVLMPFPPPQPGQMMVHPGQMMMGQPAGPQAGPRPQPQPAGLRFRRVGNNWLVGLQQNQAQHPQPGQDGWNGVMGNAAAPGAPLQPRIRLINIRIPVRALVQMAVLGLVLYQHCPPGRFLLLALGGMLFYLAGLTPLRQYLQRLAGLAPPPRPGAPPPHPPAAGPPGGAAPAPGQGGPPAAGNPLHGGGNPARGGVARVRPAGGLLNELQAFVVGFFTSLLPGWNANAEDAAAFAAAEAAAADEAGAGF